MFKIKPIFNIKRFKLLKKLPIDRHCETELSCIRIAIIFNSDYLLAKSNYEPPKMSAVTYIITNFSIICQRMFFNNYEILYYVRIKPPHETFRRRNFK